jgi:hypothetical protein
MNKQNILALLSMLLVCIGSSAYSQEKVRGPSKYSVGLITGYNRGFGIQPNFTLQSFPVEFPFEFRFGIGFIGLNPGNALDARRIFINNNTNGTPEKKGRSFDFRLDFLLPRTIFNINNSFLVFGPRYSTFVGDFKFIGGNEDFEVRSSQWGIGGGIENQFRMFKNIDLVLVFGLDYYFPSTLTGHDTSYSPDNDNVNVRNDNQNDDTPFTYKDANKAIKQPGFMPRLMLGVNFNL